MITPRRTASLRGDVDRVVELDVFQRLHQQSRKEKEVIREVGKRKRRQFGTVVRKRKPFFFKNLYRYLEGKPIIQPQPKRVSSGPSRIEYPEKIIENDRFGEDSSSQHMGNVDINDWISEDGDELDAEIRNMSIDEDDIVDNTVQDQSENPIPPRFLCSNDMCAEPATSYMECRHLACDTHKLLSCFSCELLDRLRLPFLQPSRVPSLQRATIEDKEKLLFELPPMRKSLPVGEKQERERRNHLLTFVRTLSAGSPDWVANDLLTDSGAHRLLGLAMDSIQRIHPSLVPRASIQQLSMETQLKMFANSSLNMNQLKNIHATLRDAESSPFWGITRFSERFQEQGNYISYSSKLHGEGKDSVNVVCVDNLKDTVEGYLKRTRKTLSFDSRFKGNLWMRLGVDRGGGTTKIAISFANRSNRVNSRSNWLLICVYNGKDSAEDLRQYASQIFKDFNEINSIMFDGKEVNIKKMIIGDIMSLSAVLGLVGPRSNHPCMFCTVDKNGLLKKADARTAEVAAEKLRLNSTNTRVNLSHSLPSLVIGEFDTVVPLLHCFLGPASDIFQKMEKDILQFGAAAMTNVEYPHVPIASMSADSGKDLKIATSTLNSFRQWESGNISNKTAECTPWCTLSHLASSSDMPYQQCTSKKCCKWDHAACFGFSGAKKEVPKKYMCWSCIQSKEGIVERLEERCKLLWEQVERENSAKAAKEHPVYLEWKRLCGDTNVIAQKYHGGSLNGNQTYKFLRNHTLFVNLLRKFDHPEAEFRADCYENVLFDLNILHQMTKSSWLTDSEVQTVKDSSAQLKHGMESQDILPVTPKIHKLIHHLPELAEKFRTLGLLSEQGLEALHSESDDLMDNFKKYGDIKYRIQAVMEFVNTKHTISMSFDTQCEE